MMFYVKYLKIYDENLFEYGTTECEFIGQLHVKQHKYYIVFYESECLIYEPILKFPLYSKHLLHDMHTLLSTLNIE